MRDFQTDQAIAEQQLRITSLIELRTFVMHILEYEIWCRSFGVIAHRSSVSGIQEEIENAALWRL